MKGMLQYNDGAGNNGAALSAPVSIPREWLQEWFTTICLMVVLAALVFLMMLSIYLVVTKPEPSAIPEQRQARAAGSLCVIEELPISCQGATGPLFATLDDGPT
jgi:hypothetical protein